MENPDAIARSELLAGRYVVTTIHYFFISVIDVIRYDLQHKETYSNQSLFKEAVEKFNDYSICAGKLIKDHMLFQHIKVDEVNHSGLLTSDRAYDILKAVRKKYADVVLPNFNASGHHAPFENFIQGDLDVLYLHFWLENLQNPSLTEFFGEGAKLDFGFDTSTTSAMNTPIGFGATSTNSGSSGYSMKSGNKKRKAHEEDSIQLYYATKTEILKKESMASNNNTNENSDALSKAYERRRELAKELNDCTDDEYRKTLVNDIKFESELTVQLRLNVVMTPGK